ncbi:MAG: alanine racemase [Arcobacteraceae bacterium]
MAKILLNKKNLLYNFGIISKQTGSVEKVAVVLKDNAYGHGLLEIATMASEFGIKKAVVKSIEEALVIEKLFDDILILAQKDIHTYSHTFHIALNSLDAIKNLPENINVHIKVDTGMHRNGVMPEEIETAILGLRERNIKITGVFTHHKNSDELTTDFYWQKSVFKGVKENVKAICEKLSLPIPAFHSCNSAALFRTTDFDEDFARVGIATYGYLDNAGVFNFPVLKPVMSLWASRLATRELKKGQSVGYGGTFTASEDMTVSTYDLGYGDGFLRLNERTAYTTPKGYKVLGRVSMDNLSLNTKDEDVCIFDDVHTLAKLHDTITYEITTTLSPFIKKEIV